MTKEELFGKVFALSNLHDTPDARDLLQTVWNHGKSDGLREAREMMAAAAEPSGKAEGGRDGA